MDSPSTSDRIRPLRVALAALLLLAASASPGAAAQEGVPEEERLIVATKSAPPFAIQQEDGTWRGLSIDLWQDLASDLGLAYTFVETDLEGILAGVRTDSFDVGVAALTITSEREEELDFTHPFFVSGLGIAIPSTSEGSWWTVLRKLVSAELLKVLGGLFVLLLLVGATIWWLERRKNQEQFGGPAREGIVSGVWWSAVTMTTVGYGDKAPVTLGGRLVGLVWMFAGLIIVSSVTAALTSALTVSQLSYHVAGQADLPNVRVGSVARSTSVVYLEAQNIPFDAFENLDEALAALEAGAVDAVVYDAPILQHVVHSRFRGRLRILPETFETQYYGIALPRDSRLREPLNRALLARLETPAWAELVLLYLGD